MGIKVDDYGCECTLDKQGDEFVIRLSTETDDSECTLVSYVNIEELKSTIRLFEEEENNEAR